jgi:hypothetical protein
VPKLRADKGHGRCLDPELRELLCDIRTESLGLRAAHPDDLVAEARRVADKVSPQVVRKMLAERRVKRIS